MAAALLANATPNIVANPGTGSPNRLLYTPVAGTPTPDPTPAPGCPSSETATGTFAGTGSQALLASCVSSAGTAHRRADRPLLRRLPAGTYTLKITRP